MSNGLKMLTMAASTLITCIVISLGFLIAREGQNKVNGAIEQLNGIMDEYSKSDYSIYDGSSVSGREVASVIKEAVAKEEYLAIVVKTAAGTVTHYNYFYTGTINTDFSPAGSGQINKTGDYETTLETQKGSSDYINPSSSFSGQVITNENGVVIAIFFKQRGA